VNYLGHSFFSKDKDNYFVTGNVLGDFFKGRTERMEGPKDLVEGIVFHRNLDQKTDINPFIIKSKNSLIHCGLYKGVIIDIYTDYFFAKYWDKYNLSSLAAHTKGLYDSIETSYEYLPLEAQKTFFYLKRDNVLYNYKELDFIEEVFYRMSNYSKKGDILKESVKFLKQNEKFYEDNFFDFMNDFNINK